MAQLSYINTGVKQTPDLTLNIPTDESVGAFLFDTSGFDKPRTDRYNVLKIWMMHFY